MEHGRGTGPSPVGRVDPPGQARYGVGGPGDEGRDGILSAPLDVVLQKIPVGRQSGQSGTRQRERLAQLLGPARDRVLELEDEIVVARLEAAQRHHEHLRQPAVGRGLDRQERSLPLDRAAGSHDGESGGDPREARLLVQGRVVDLELAVEPSGRGERPSSQGQRVLQLGGPGRPTRHR